jgi:hypothetical protein
MNFKKESNFMGMHPKFDLQDYCIFYELLFENDNLDAVDKLCSIGLISSDLRPRWVDFFEQLKTESHIRINTIDYFKLNIDKQIEDSSFLSSKSPIQIVNNFVSAATSFGHYVNNINNIRGKTILDYGAGIYRTLNQSVILYCNGFDRVVAYEPYPIKQDFVTRSFYQLIERMSNKPEDYIFSNIQVSEFISRLKSFIDIRTDEKIQHFSTGLNDEIRISGLLACKDLSKIQPNSIDYHFSNAVLEHVDNIPYYLGKLYKLAKDQSAGFHIVDFLDHRYYDNNKLSGMEKYYDGILDEINGLTPSEMELQILECGWKLNKLQALKLPDNYLSNEKRLILPRYSTFQHTELSEHVNWYILKKNTLHSATAMGLD